MQCGYRSSTPGHRDLIFFVPADAQAAIDGNPAIRRQQNDWNDNSWWGPQEEKSPHIS